MLERCWWRNEVIYAVDVAAFSDGDGDGLGDLTGLRRRLDYIVDLGVGCVWLSPIYPSPRRDGGYDVIDHCAIDPRFGTRRDFDEFVAAAHASGLRIVIDLVASHTSDQHRWFEASRRGDPLYRDYYIWRDEPDRALDVEPIFPGVADDVWSYDQVACKWYLRRFYTHEPDLNIAHDPVRDEIAAIVRHWLDAGVDGFRVDAAPYLAQKASWADGGGDGHWFLRDLRNLLVDLEPDAVLMAETDVAPSAYDEFLANGDGMHLLFNFYANNHLFLSLARRDGASLGRAVAHLATRGATTGFVNWVRNHDELDLERLSESARDEVYRAFARDKDARVYGRGIRRRLPPMVDGDRSLVELALSTVFSLPGIPILRYGEEIGMGDDLSLPERVAVRTAMQWTSEPNTGFCNPDLHPAVPVIRGGPFGASAVNVADQLADPGSLLHWTRDLVKVRSGCPEIGTEPPEVLHDVPRGVLALLYAGPSRQLVIAHNFATSTATMGGKRLPNARMLFPRRDAVASGVTMRPGESAWLEVPRSASPA